MEIYTPFSQHVGKRKILAIAAHQDDIELMAYSGIFKTKLNPDYGFSAVVCSDGRNSPRIGIYADYTEQMMIDTRRKEQIGASEIGNYEKLYMLNYTSEDCKKLDSKLTSDLIKLILEVKPEIIMTHNLMDKHDTHIGVASHVIQALRSVKKDFTPEQILGCEVWRGLDWIDDEDKIPLDCGSDPQLQYDLLNVFVSQVAGGKSYDKAGVGRRYANATFFASHSCDNYQMINYAVDLMPLIDDVNMSFEDYCSRYIDKFKKTALKTLERVK